MERFHSSVGSASGLQPRGRRFDVTSKKTQLFCSHFHSQTLSYSTLLSRYHVVSQMQPIESRKVFPCFDEPSFKARFQINIIHPTGTTAISNTDAVDRLEHKTYAMRIFNKNLKNI